MASGKLAFHEMQFYWGSNDASVGLVVCLTDASLSISNEEIDATCFDDDGAYDSLPGQQKSTIDISGFYIQNASGDNRDGSDIVADAVAKTEREFTLMTVNATGNQRFDGDGWISNVSVQSSMGSVITFSATINVRGAIDLDVLA